MGNDWPGGLVVNGILYTMGNHEIKLIGMYRQCEMTYNGEYQLIDKDRQCEMTYNGEYQLIDDGRQWEMTYCGEYQLIDKDRQCEMTDCGEYQLIDDGRQCEMTDCGEYQLIDDGRQCEITPARMVEKGELYIMEMTQWKIIGNYKQWELTDHGNNKLENTRQMLKKDNGK